jgi:hypothetical protein
MAEREQAGNTGQGGESVAECRHEKVHRLSRPGLLSRFPPPGAGRSD